MKHTPGPWQVSGVRARSLEIGRDCQLHMVGPDGDSVAAVFFNTRTGLGLADAHLIAAAPDLRAALVAAKEAWGGSEFPSALVEAALAKADGRPS